jgi:pimeloyl-ACP methyl ester carboxylesterase
VDPVDVPTTYVWSDGDVAIGRTAAEACVDHVTGDYRFVELPGITHWIPEQAPEELARAVLDRIASGPARDVGRPSGPRGGR